jgi:mannitol-1-phosphate 5-dehydrogenase
MPAEVAAADPLVVWAEAYNQIIADRGGFIGQPPQVDGLVLKDNFSAYVDRKLFIHNLGHSTAAYLGYLAGLERIWQCMGDQTIRVQTREAMMASADGLINRYPDEFNTVNQTAHVDDLIRRFSNQALNDSVYRVGRDLFRKLAAEDRCVGSLRLVASTDGDPSAIYRSLAAGLCFKATDEAGRMYERDAEFQTQLDRQGPEAMLAEVCGLKRPADDAHIDAVIDQYETLKPTA